MNNLDRQVAEALGKNPDHIDIDDFHPSTNLAQGGLIIVNNDISVIKVKSSFPDEQWAAYLPGRMQQKEYGPTHLFAAMNALVASKS